MWRVVAFQGQIVSKESLSDWTRVTVNVLDVFKAGNSRIVRGEQLFVWSLSRNTAPHCRCPNLRPGQVMIHDDNDDDDDDDERMYFDVTYVFKLQGHVTITVKSLSS